MSKLLLLLLLLVLLLLLSGNVWFYVAPQQ